MFIFAGNTPKRQQRYVIGGGIFDWIPSLTNVSRSAGNFISANKDTIKNVADVVGNVAKTGATTASAIKQIVDAVKAKRATGAKKAAAALPTPLAKTLSEKSIDFLKQLAHSSETSPLPGRVAELPDINSRIAGAGFKTIRPLAPTRKGKRLLQQHPT